MQSLRHNAATAQPMRRPASSEEGYMLLAVVVLTALVLISLSVAAPMVARDLRRDKEVESEHRAQQYVRAIRLYQRKFPGQYPPSMDALEKSNNIRFLRKQYVDPLTGKSDWRVIHYGQQKTTIKIPFGMELAGISAGGLGSAAGMASPGLGSAGTTNTSTIGATSALAAGFGGATVTTTTGGSAFGASGSTGGVTSKDATSFSGGGGPVVGVGTSRTGDSILDPNQQTTYDTWEFWYDPRIETLYKTANILGGGGLSAGSGSSSGISSTSASSFGQDAVSGQSNSSKGSSGSAGSTGSTSPQ